MKILNYILTIGVVALTFISCSKEDEYMKYLEGGEIIYTGKADSLSVFSGNKRVQLNWLLIADPKITKTKIYWNSRRDSMEIPVKRTAGIDTFNVIVPGLNEATYFFEVFNFDKDGRTSVVSSKSGKAYGERYEAFMLNRGVLMSFKFPTGPTSFGVQIFFNDHVATESNIMLGTEIFYTDANDLQQSLYVPAVTPAPGQSTPPVVIMNYKGGTPMTYRSLYLPDKTSIDTFHTSLSTMVL